MAELSGIDDPGARLAGLFSHAPVGFQIYTADGRSILSNPKFREAFGNEPPPGYNALRDEQAAEVGVLDLVGCAFAGETVTIPAFWYDPRDPTHMQVTEGRRVAIEITAFLLRGRDDRTSHVAMVHKEVTADPSSVPYGFMHRHPTQCLALRASQARCQLLDREILAQPLRQTVEKQQLLVMAPPANRQQSHLGDRQIAQGARLPSRPPIAAPRPHVLRLLHMNNTGTFRQKSQAAMPYRIAPCAGDSRPS